VNARERITRAEIDISKSLAPILQSLRDETGLIPRDIDIEMIDTTTYGDRAEQRELGRVKLRF
jgi:hypothetical protein